MLLLLWCFTLQASAQFLLDNHVQVQVGNNAFTTIPWWRGVVLLGRYQCEIIASAQPLLV